MRFIDPGTQSAGVGGGVCQVASSELSNCFKMSMVQFSGEVVDGQRFSKKECPKKVQFGAEKAQFLVSPKSKVQGPKSNILGVCGLVL